MKTQTQSSVELNQLCKSITSASVVMLTNLDADGALLTRPMAPVEIDGDGGLWFFTDLRATRADHSRVANVSFTDRTCGTHVSLSGRSEIDTDRTRIERLWASFAKPAFSAGLDSPNLALLKFVPDLAGRWDTPQGKMTQMFAQAAVGVGNPIDVSD